MIHSLTFLISVLPSPPSLSSNFNIELTLQVKAIQSCGHHMTIVPTISCAMIIFKILYNIDFVPTVDHETIIFI